MPTRDEPSKKESFWPFGPTNEAVASFDTSGFFSGFGGAISENTWSSTFEIEEGPIQGLGLWNHVTGGRAAIMGLFGAFCNVSSEETINTGEAPGTRTYITGTLTTLARALIMAVMLLYAWLTLGSFLFNRVALTNTNGQPETFGGTTNAEDGLALSVVPAAEKRNRGSNSLVSVIVDSGASGHYFDDALIPGLRYRLDNYLELAIRGWITTAGGHQLEGGGQGLLRGHIIDAHGVRRVIQISVSFVPGLGRNLFSVKQASRKASFPCLTNTIQGWRQTTSCFRSKSLKTVYTFFRWTLSVGAARRSSQCKRRLPPPFGIGGWSTSTGRVWTS